MEYFIRDGSKDERGFKKDLKDLYSVYEQYKKLFQYYQDHKFINYVMIEDRIEQLRKHPKAVQRSELETLLWVKGDINEKTK